MYLMTGTCVPSIVKENEELICALGGVGYVVKPASTTGQMVSRSGRHRGTVPQCVVKTLLLDLRSAERINGSWNIFKLGLHHDLAKMRM
jgi:hypothetical protein